MFPRYPRLVFAAVALTAVGLAQPALREEDFTLRTSSHLVVLNVGVQDSRGQNVRGLDEGDFKVFEDGRIQPIKQFSGGDAPVTVGMIVDASGSMRTRQAEVVTAVLAFVRSGNQQDETFVVNFSDGPWLGLPPGVPFSNNPRDLRVALLGPRPQGKTALYDALVMAAEHLAKGKWESKALLLVSDGGDNNSRHHLADAIRAVHMSGATVYTIGLFDPEEGEHNLGTLKEIANLTGGESFTPESLLTVEPLCLRVARDIRESYTVAYTPPHAGHDIRKVRVLATLPQGGKLSARTRTTYIFTER